MQASINKQTASSKNQEKELWGSRFKAAERTLDMLKEEIVYSGDYEMLKNYLQKKDLDLENAKYSIKITHVNKVNHVYEQEAENWKYAMILGAEIIQDCYLLLRGFDNLDAVMQEKMEVLVKLYQGQRSVKFEEKMQSPEQLENILNLSDFERESKANEPSKKRTMLEEMVVEEKRQKAAQDFQFARPSAAKVSNFEVPVVPAIHVNINETQVICRAASEEAMETDDMNATYCMPTKPVSTKASANGPKTLVDANQNVAKLLRGKFLVSL